MVWYHNQYILTATHRRRASKRLSREVFIEPVKFLPQHNFNRDHCYLHSFRKQWSSVRQLKFILRTMCCASSLWRNHLHTQFFIFPIAQRQNARASYHSHVAYCETAANDRHSRANFGCKNYTDAVRLLTDRQSYFLRSKHTTVIGFAFLAKFTAFKVRKTKFWNSVARFFIVTRQIDCSKL